MTIDLSTYLSRIPRLRGADPVACRRLAGLTNLNFLVEAEGGTFVLRVPGEGTSEYINRAHEEVAARSAADAGVNAEVVFFDASDGLMVTKFVEGAVTMSPEAFRDPETVRRAGEVLRRLHHRARPFAHDFTLFSMIDDYKDLIAAKGATLPHGYDYVQQRAETARAALEANPVPLAASHCDPLCENFLDTGEKMLLIDYEYAGNNDPMWDLGDLSVEASFTAEQDELMLRSYFGGDPPVAQVGRMIAYKAFCDLLWTLWGVIQHVNGNPADDFWAYATGRFNRSQELMNRSDFGDYVSLIGTDRSL